MAETVKQIIQGAMRALGVLEDGEQPTAQEAADGLTALRNVIDEWSLLFMVPATTIETFNLSQDKRTYTWAAGGDFNSAAPEEVLEASFGDGAGNTFHLKPADAKWWARQTRQAVISRPQFYWYEYGSFRFAEYPVDPLLTVVSLKALANAQALTDETGFATGFDRALRFHLALEIAPEFGVEPSPQLQRNAATSYRVIRNRYKRVPILEVDKGLQRRRVDYNITSGPT